MSVVSSSQIQRVIFRGSDDIEIILSSNSDILTISGHNYKSEFTGNDLIISKSRVIYLNAKVMPEIIIKGSGDVKLTGDGENVEILSDGSGDMDASKLKVKNLTFTLNGSGNAKVYAWQRADITLDGSGKVKIKGSPKIVNKMGNHAYNIK